MDQAISPCARIAASITVIVPRASASIVAPPAGLETAGWRAPITGTPSTITRVARITPSSHALLKVTCRARSTPKRKAGTGGNEAPSTIGPTGDRACVADPLPARLRAHDPALPGRRIGRRHVDVDVFNHARDDDVEPRKCFIVRQFLAGLANMQQWQAKSRRLILTHDWFPCSMTAARDDATIPTCTTATRTPPPATSAAVIVIAGSASIFTRSPSLLDTVTR